MFQRLTDKCFRKCIDKPGGTLDNSEQVRYLLYLSTVVIIKKELIVKTSTSSARSALNL